MSNQEIESATRGSVAPPSGTALLGLRRVDEPIAHRPERRLAGDPRDPPAARAALRARMRGALARGEAEAEAVAAGRLARHLLTIDTHLDEAVACGRRALALRADDEPLRRMMAVALRSLGEPGLAAALLRPVVDKACARASRDASAVGAAVAGLLELGDLLLRAGDVEGATESFRYVAVVAPERPDGQERLAIARGIAPSIIAAEVAARAYIGAAKKHQLAGDDARALEALARAFEADPTSTLAANVLADSLEELGRIEAADAVRAEHARACVGRLEAAAVVHAARREKARVRDDRATVIATVLDELVDLVGTAAPGAARLRERARVEAALEEIPALATPYRRVHALLAGGHEALDAWRAIARAPSASPEARLDAWTECVAHDLGDGSALAAMREHARVSRDPTTIVDALIRGLRGAPPAADPELIASRCAELAGWADEQLDDAPLAAWAWQRTLERTPDDRHARDELSRLGARIRQSDERLATAERDGETDDPSAKADALRREIRALFGRPDREHQIVAAVEDLLEVAPADPFGLSALERLARRAPGDEGRFALELRERAATVPAERARIRLERVEAALRRGQIDAALSLAGGTEHSAVAPTQVALAVRSGGLADLGGALARFAPGVRERAAVLAAAARALRLAGSPTDALGLAEEALRDAPRDVRGAIELAELATAHPDAVPDELATTALERALATVGARSRWSLALARLADTAREAPLAVAWTRRAWSLQPGDVGIAALWLARGVTLREPEVLAEVVRATTALVASLAPIAHELGAAASALLGDDVQLGEQVARELLALGGARIAPIREAMLAAKNAPPSLLVALQERWLASGAPAADRPRVLLAIADVARGADPSRAADAAARVLSEPEADPQSRTRAFALVRELAGTTLDPDAELAVAHALAEQDARDADDLLDRAPRARLSTDDDARLRGHADRLRELGRDAWDLADDRETALRAWLAGARLLGAEGLERLELDIAHFGGDDAARDALFELARRDEPETGASAARRARADEFRLRAWARLLAHPPTWIEPLSLAREAAARADDPAALLPSLESLAHRHGQVDALHELYEIAAGRTAGRFGMRAVHYRAARVLDRLGRRDDALAHAVKAFAAAPSEGAMLLMVERLARGSKRAEVAIGALVEAADESTDVEKKATWLERAAAISESSDTTPEERVDLLLRLFLTAPSARSVDGLIATVRAVVADDPALRDTWTLRLSRAYRRVENEIGWSQRVSVLSSVARALADLEGTGAALDLLAKGAANTPRADLDPLRETAGEIAARDPETARGWLDRATARGPLHPHVAWGSGDPDRALELLAETAPAADDFDLGGDAGEPSRELQYLERWAPSARDKRTVARAWERFGRRQGAAAELEAAKALDEAGQTQEAAELLVEAWRNRAQAGPDVLRDILALARAILPQAGADAALVEMLVDDLQTHEGGDPKDRVARYREVAELRATRLGDRRGALEALVEAGRTAPADDDLWNEIGDLAEAIGAHERLAAALAQRLQRARPEKRVTLLRKLARVLEHDLGRDDEAAERWAELVRLLPLDAEAADALERIAERRGDGAQLLDLLRARAARLPVGHAERTRALRRIARELGGMQGRRGEVLSALREVHQQNPGDVDVATQLAALARTAGDLGTAAEALMRSFRAVTREDARVQLAIDAARVLLELHDHDTASRILHDAASGGAFEQDARALELVRLQLEVAIARADTREEALARIRVADLDVHATPERRAANAIAASRALVSLGEVARAKALAWSAARAAPGDVAIAALLAELEFGATGHARRAPSAEDGELLGVLLAVPHRATAPADALAVIAFARAELLDLARGPGAGYQDLNAWPDEVRAKAPWQIAIAERLAAEWSFGQAAAAYERAFAGDLRGVRAVGPAALAAADAAARSNDPGRARAFLDLAARDPACRIDARRRAVELARAIGDFDAALRALERMAAEATGNVRAQALADQARLLRSRDPEAASEAMRLALQAAEEGTPLHEELGRERDALESKRSSRSLPPAPPPSLRDSGVTAKGAAASFDKAMAMMMGGGTAEPAPASRIEPQSESEPPPRVDAAREDAATIARVALQRASQRAPAEPPPPPPSSEEEPPRSKLSEHPRLSMVGEAPIAPLQGRSRTPALPRPAGTSGALDLAALGEIAHDVSAPVVERVRALKTLGEAAHEGGREDEATRHFISALELGDVAAGDQAAELLAMMPGRTNDLLLVRRRQAFLAPGDRSLLDALHEAALSLRDHVFARAIDHVRRAFDPAAGPVPPPPLEVQLDRPDLLLPLLERRANPAAAEALRLTWDNAPMLLRKDGSTTLQRGVDRVTTALPIGRVAAAATRLLGGARTPVWLRQRPGRDVEVLLSSPPAVVLGGDCREDSADTRYALGAGLIAAQAAQCLLLAQPEPAARATWQALLSAFGPPEHGRGVGPEVGRLAAALWQSIPRAPQRRLGELLGHDPPGFEAAIEGARQVARRGGLYVSGDLGAAVRATFSEVADPQLLAENPDMAAICVQYPKIGDLYRLATSPEFAEARWRVPGGPRRSPSSGSTGGVQSSSRSP
ncbi:MAG: hypothetical protein HYV09_08495 [Deltaproteobacteria bacterium]|nr:hypothetical protein [Deltaproteobacteria bacterium]